VVAFELAPDPGDRGEPDVRQGTTGGSVAGDPRLVDHGRQVLARGALVCPSCSLPISPVPRVRPRAMLSCAFCDHSARALDFLRRDVLDAPANDVVLIARYA
jgi:hypothetical protein